ncbi:MAG: DUF255 domain-containing protein [Thermodesulfobacteriota bacterium]
MKNSTARFFLWAVLMGIVSCCFSSSVLFAADANAQGKPEIAWHDYEEGLSLAKSSGKKLYLHFYTTRCHYCKVMQSETFTDNQVIAMLNENFIPIKVDLGARPSLGSVYPSPGVPMSWFLESNGDKIGSRAGYLPPDQFMEMLQFIIAEKYKQ